MSVCKSKCLTVSTSLVSDAVSRLYCLMSLSLSESCLDGIAVR